MNSARGFTLVEMLVSLVLLSSIVLVGSTAYGLFAKRWDGQLGNFDISLQNSRDLMLVQEVLDNLIPYIVYREDGMPVVYFEGNRNGFVAVSSRSVFAGRIPAVVRFSVVQNLDFSFDVFYDEWVMSDDVLRSTVQSFTFSEPIKLFSNISSPSFNYLGWTSTDERFGVEGSTAPQLPSWHGSFDATTLPFAPLKAKLVFDYQGFNYQINAALMEGVTGVVSNYRGSRGRMRNEKGEPLKPIDDCYC